MRITPPGDRILTNVLILLVMCFAFALWKQYSILTLPLRHWVVSASTLLSNYCPEIWCLLFSTPCTCKFLIFVSLTRILTFLLTSLHFYKISTDSWFFSDSWCLACFSSFVLLLPSQLHTTDRANWSIMGWKLMNSIWGRNKVLDNHQGQRQETKFVSNPLSLKPKETMAPRNFLVLLILIEKWTYRFDIMWCHVGWDLQSRIKKSHLVSVVETGQVFTKTFLLISTFPSPPWS